MYCFILLFNLFNSSATDFSFITARSSASTVSYRECCPHPRGTTVNVVPNPAITTVSIIKSNPITAVLPRLPR